MALTETTTGAAATIADDGIEIIDGPAQTAPSLPTPKMRVRKRDGSFEPVDPMKIVTRIQRCAEGLDGVDPMRVATRTISGLHDGATTVELDELAIRTAATNIIEEPNYSKLAGRLLATYIHEELRNENIKTFSQSIRCWSPGRADQRCHRRVRRSQCAAVQQCRRSPTRQPVRVLRSAYRL